MESSAFLFPASSACARSLVLPGTQALPVILPANGPTRPIPRLSVLGTVPPFSPPEPPLLFVVLPTRALDPFASPLFDYCVGTSSAFNRRLSPVFAGI